jgi:hypothetical protein
MHPVNRYRWRSGSSGRPLTPRRGSAVGNLERAARPQPGSGPSTTDVLVVDSARREAQRRVGRAGRRGGWTAWRADRLAARAADLRRRAAWSRAAPTRAASGAALAPEERIERHRLLAGTVAEGGERHRRPGRGARFVARLIPWVDALLFGWFVAGVSNADLAEPWTTPVESLVTVGFTAFVVLTVAVLTPWLGRSLRPYKSPSGQARFAEIGPVLTGLLGLWAVVAAAIAVTMYVRVDAEAGYAGADPLAGGTVAVLLALASVAMTAFVLLVAVSDGTPEADELRALGRTQVRTESRAGRLERRARRCDDRRARVARAAERREIRMLARAAAGLSAAPSTVELVRLRTGVPADRPMPPVPTVADLQQTDLLAVRDHLRVTPFE